MLLKELTPDQLNEIAQTIWGENAALESVIADALRAEICARRIVTRRTLCNRVLELLQPIYQVQVDVVKTGLEELEYAGDITSGDNGQLAAAPLRAVQIDINQYLFVGGPDTKTLQKLVDCEINNSLVPRRATARDSSKVLTQLSVCNAKVLSPHRWSGLDRAPLADSAWLSDLDDELKVIGKPGLALESNCDEWRVYTSEVVADGERSRWSKPRNDDNGSLWRARHIRGYWLYVWTNQTHPMNGMHIPLTASDAHRSCFALDRVAGKSLTLEYERNRDEVHIQLPTLLPSQEYRYLITIGERNATSSYMITIPVSLLEQLVSLFERLGITLKERGA